MITTLKRCLKLEKVAQSQVSALRSTGQDFQRHELVGTLVYYVVTQWHSVTINTHELSGTYCHITYHSQLLTRSYRSNKSFSGIQGADDGLWDREMATSYRLQSISCTIRRHKHIFEPLSGRGHVGL